MTQVVQALRPRKAIYLAATLLSAALILFTISQPLSAGATTSKEAKLAALKKQIRDARTTLTDTTSKKNRLQLQLQETEIAIGELSRSLAKLAIQLKQQQRELRKRQQEKKNQSQQLKQQQQRLAQQIRASYAMGNQGYAKLFLNQQEPSTIGRTLVYYDYLNQSRMRSIQSIEQRITALARIENEIRNKQQRITRAQQQRQKEKRTLEEKRQTRQQVLASIQKDLKSQAQRLVQLEQARKALESLIASLSKALADIPPDAGDIKQLRQLKGKLLRPVKGRTQNRFGKQRKGGNLKWQGITINARAGTPVRAIHHGRIAFSDWLRGFGMLVIIDHGDGYMSLYGHNESLYKDVGEWVESGEIVATVGESGGQSRSGLYFEIRKNGKPLNPRQWLARK